jgi:hypothetical protein
VRATGDQTPIRRCDIGATQRMLGFRPSTSRLLLTAGSITLRNGACLVVPTPSNKHRHGTRQVATTPTTAVDPNPWPIPIVTWQSGRANE